MAAAAGLSEEDLGAVRAELSEDRPVTVWFTSAAVGVPAGGSAKVVALDDAAEGDFIQVRPAGSRDTMFCSPNELTRTRPARKRASRPKAEAPPAGAAQPRATQPGAAEPDAAKLDAAEPDARKPEVKAEPAPPSPPAEPTRPAVDEQQKAAERPRPAAPRAAARPAEVTVTLNATAEGEWTVEVTVGPKRRVRPTPVQPAEVAKAARSLPPAVAEAIESSLEAARLRQQERVERLRAELEAAQRALRDLSG
jgi:hypothetical protein